MVGALVALIAASCGDGAVEGATSTGTPSTTSPTTVALASTSSSTEASTTTTSQATTTTTTEPPTTTSSSIPPLPEGVENVVRVNLINRYNFDAGPGPEHGTVVFENREVEGSLQSHVFLDNVTDDSAAPIYGLGLTFSTDHEVDPKGVHPDTIADGVLTWEFGDVEEAYVPVGGTEIGTTVDFGVPVRFTPGMDVSISHDRTLFGGPGTQTVTLTVVAQQDFSFWDFIFHLHGAANEAGRLADVEVISLESGEQVGPVGERIAVAPDRKDVAVDTLPPLAAGETYTFEMTVSVDPKEPGTRYRPYVAIAWLDGSGTNPASVEGDVLSLSLGELGTWEWTSAGMYTWEWQQGLQYNLTLNGHY